MEDVAERGIGSGSAFMTSGIIEERLGSFDDRFEIEGEILLDVKEGRATFQRVIIAWKLFNEDDDASIKEIVLVLEGMPSEIAKIICATGKEDTMKPSSTDAASGSTYIILRMHEELVNEIRVWAKDGETRTIPAFLMGASRVNKIFDLSRYDALAIGQI